MMSPNLSAGSDAAPSREDRLLNHAGHARSVKSFGKICNRRYFSRRMDAAVKELTLLKQKSGEVQIDAKNARAAYLSAQPGAKK